MAVGFDKDRKRMLRAVRRKSAKRATAEETQEAARIAVAAMPPVAEVKREVERLRGKLK